MLRQHRYFIPFVYVLILLASVCLLVGGGWFFTKSPVFRFSHVGFDSHAAKTLRHVDAHIIEREALPLIKGNFFTADLDQVRESVESVPWVHHAQVRREWPNRLVVSIDEYAPLGLWGDDGQLVSTDGDVFTANVAEAEAEGRPLPVFQGPAGTEHEVVARYRSLQKALLAIKATPTQVQLTPRYAWSVVLDNGMTVALGKEADASRLARFITVYPQLVAKYQDKIEYVDLRYESGIAIKGSGVLVKPDKPKK